MSDNIHRSIEMLPVELFHQIFDNLHIQTILFSIRPVCRLFRSVVDNYNRYVLNFHFISKSNFYLFCRLINPENIISLTLSNDKQTPYQIHLFMSLVRLREITRLRSLTLRQINEDQLNFILKQINLKALISLSCHIRKCNSRREKTSLSLLPLTTAQTSLRKLELDTCRRMTEISRSINTILEYLDRNNHINIDDLCKILHFSPHLRTLIMSEIPPGTINNSTPIYFRQLSSLTIQNFSVTIYELELFLSLTPSLVYLKLIGGLNILDGKRWEEFIQINLPQLDKFEFYFTLYTSRIQSLPHLKPIVGSFKTPFWVEHKKLFIDCDIEYTLNTQIISIYSIPICTSYMRYMCDSGNTLNDDIQTMDNIKSLALTLSKLTINAIKVKRTTAHSPLFSKVTDIDLEFSDDWPLISLQSLFVLIDISRIVHIRISINYITEYNQNLLMNIKIFIEQAVNLFSLLIDRSFYRYRSNITIEDIHSIVPQHVKHLQIPINDLYQINMILERCKSLVIIEFDVGYTECSKEVIDWFADNTINTTCRENDGIVVVWLGKKIIQSTDIYIMFTNESN